jgi:alpha-D-ribose 1-methylphosphonate 5-triphosphate diphosphatase
VKNFSAPVFIRNARLVLHDQILSGSLSTGHGCISSIDPGNSNSGDDWEGDYLIPGLVEIHTDNLEKHLMPRPKVNWPVLPAIIAHDAKRLPPVSPPCSMPYRLATLIPTVCAISRCNPVRRDWPAPAGLLRAEHLLHLRSGTC